MYCKFKEDLDSRIESMFEVMTELSKNQSEALKAQDKLIVDRVE